MNSLFKIGFAGVVACVLVSCSDSMEGVWQGECRNEMVDTTSGMKMTIKQEGENGDKLVGILMLTGDLYGSGKLTGYVNGKDVTIHSEGDTQTFVNIIWTGRVKGDTFSGTYRVEPTPSAAMLGRGVQKGTFIMHRQ
jgi:hypothetical protein